MSSDLSPVTFSTLIPESYSLWTLWWATVLLVTVVPSAFLFLKIKRKSDMLWKVPGSNGNPFLVAVAVVRSIISHKRINSNVVSFQVLCGVTQMFNRERIYRFWFGFRPIIVFFKPETIEVVLSSNTILDKSFVYQFLNEWFKDGLITSTGGKWKKRRKLLTPAFHFRILEDFLPVINEHASVLVQKLKQQAPLGQFDMVPHTTLCSLDILCETAMGKYVGAQTKADNPYLEALSDASEMFMYRIMRPWLWPDWIFHLSPGGRRFQECMHLMGDFTRNVIRERKLEMIKRIKSGEDSDEEASGYGKSRKAFLDILVRNHLADETFTEEDIREEVDTFMFAGHDTTAVGMSWALYLIGLYPEVQRKIYEEVNSIFGDDKDRPVTMDDIKEMKYIECVMKESQRLYPSLPLIGRELQEDAVINGYPVPAGTGLMIFTYMLHRNEEIFPRAEFFDPDRFLPENCSGRHPYAYIPFSAGPRNCIGQKFAVMEQKVVLANIIRNFTLNSLEQRDQIQLVSEMVLRSENGIKMVLEPR